MNTIIRLTKKQGEASYRRWKTLLAKDPLLQKELKAQKYQEVKTKARLAKERKAMIKRFSLLPPEGDPEAVVDIKHLFTMTPRDAESFSGFEDPIQVLADLKTYGGITGPQYSIMFATQYEADEIILGGDPVGLDKKTIGYGLKKCVIRVHFNCSGIPNNKKFLVAFKLRAVEGECHAQLFLYHDWHTTAKLTSDDAAGFQFSLEDNNVPIDVYARLASPDWNAKMGFKGVDCLLY